VIQGRSGGAGERSPQPVHARLTEISRPYPKPAESEPGGFEAPTWMRSKTTTLRISHTLRSAFNWILLTGLGLTTL
jgi:hypothetical protein